MKSNENAKSSLNGEPYIVCNSSVDIFENFVLFQKRVATLQQVIEKKKFKINFQASDQPKDSKLYCLDRHYHSD